MDEGFEVLTAVRICVVREATFKGLSSKKKKKKDRVGEIEGTQREGCVCIYMFINIAEIQKKGSAGLAMGATCWYSTK